MTILASSSVKATFANRLVVNNKLGTAGSAISLYSGAKPTSASFITNYNATYSTAGTVLCWHGTGGTVWSLTGNTVYLSTPPTAAVPLKNGTVTWGVIWCGTGFAAGTTFPSAGTNFGFIICDVSTVAAATGVIQLLNTTLATTDPALTIDTAGFTIA